MKFSIIITSYNKGSYIEKCIKSCLEQSEKNFEIIVCDNYSDDGSIAIFEKYKKFVKLIQKKKISIHSPLNQIDLIKTGFLKTTGDIICLLDGDDYLLPEKLNILKKKFNEKKTIEVIYDLALIKKQGYLQKFKLKKKYQKNIWPTIVNTSSITLKKTFLKECIENNILEKFNFLEVDFRINVYSRCIKKNFEIIPEDLTIYRKVSGSIMSQIKKYSKKWWQKRFQAHQFMKEEFNKKDLLYKNILDYNLTKFLSKLLK
jgi:glycosyltransferase involved in cell wall biosynthesis